MKTKFLMLISMLMMLVSAEPEKIVESGRRSLFSDEKGEIKMIIMAVIGIVIAAILIAALIPSSVQSLINARNTSWATGLLSVYDAIPIFAFLAALLIFVAIVIKLVD